MTRPVLAAAVLAICTCASVAACSSDKGPTVNSGAIAWSEKVCKTIEAGSAKLSQLPAVDPTNPAAAKSSLVNHLGSLSDALGEIFDGLRSAGAPPVSDGQATLDKALNTLTTTRSIMDVERSELAAATVSDQATFQAAISDVSKVIAQVSGKQGPATDLKSNPELATAFASASTCQKIDRPIAPSN